MKIVYVDGTEEYFEVDAVGDHPDSARNLKRFLESPHVTLVNENEITVIPSTSIRSVSITRTGPLPADALSEIPGVIVGARRVHG